MSCAIIPQVKNKQNEIVDSKLFKDLLSYLNRNKAVDIYYITKNEEFIKDHPKLKYDENNEPTIQSLLKETSLNKVITDDKIIDKLNKEIGYLDNKNNIKRHELNDVNYKMLKQKAINFNQNNENSDEFVAKVIKSSDKQTGKLYTSVKIEKRNKLNSIEANQMQYNEKLNTKLRSILNQYGIKEEALTNLENRLNINGVTDFSLAETVADGVIRLAEGIKGEKALPEEFSHFMFEALDSPLKDRLINAISDYTAEILGNDYELYDDKYNGDKVLLAKEAIGKQISNHLFNEFPLENKPYKNLLQRVIESIKNLFNKINKSDIERAKIEVNNELKQIAKGLLNQSINLDFRQPIVNKTKLYNLQDRVNKDKELLNKIINNELKRYKVYEKRSNNKNFDASQKLLIDNLEESLENNTELEAINNYVSGAITQLNLVSSKLHTISSDNISSLNQKSSILRDIRNYLYSYEGINDEIRKVVLEEGKYEDNRYNSTIKESINQLSGLLKDLRINYNKEAMPLFVEFIKPFVGESITIPFGKYKNKTYTVEQMLEIADKDISFFDRWLDSMADSSDFILKGIDQAVKKSKETSRLKTMEVMEELKAATIKLEQSGIKDTEWMFEKIDGKNTGKYIEEINHSLFKKNMSQMYKSLDEKYGKERNDDYTKDRREWFKQNMEYIDGKYSPKLSIYGNKVYANLNQVQKEYYNTILNIKGKLDAMLPEDYTTLNNAVKIRKDLIERLKSSDNKGYQLLEAIKDQVIRRSDDTEFSDKAAIKDFEGNEVQILPIFYTKLKEGEDPNDISTDIVSTLSAYASMAHNYDEMGKIINNLELGRDLLRERDVVQTEGGKPLSEKFKSLNRKVESKLTKSGGETRIVQRLNDFFDMQVYGRYMADEGTFGDTKIDKGKVANLVNSMTSVGGIALNVLGGISNILTGTIMMRTESLSKEFFTEKNTINADRTYGKELSSYLSEIGSRVKTSKLALWNELFDTMQDFDKEIRDLKFDQKSIFSKMLNTNSLFFINNAGEHWMQTRTSLALADNYKMKDNNGKTVSLWDAFEVKYIDPNNKSLGAKLEIKEGYTKEDGSPFTKDDIIKFSRKSAALNERMHGIYNKADRNAFQRLAIGRMAMLFRKWMRPAFNRRFSSAQYNYDLESWTEGYYNTSFRFLTTLAKDIRSAQFSLATRFNELTNTEKANLRRAITEVSHFLLTALVLGLLKWNADKDRPWLTKMAEYQARRLYTELGVLVPGPQMISEGLKLLKSPAAGINTLENTLNLTRLLNPYNYFTEIKSGKYEGHSIAYKSFFNSPLIPINKTVYNALHPEQALMFYK